MKSEQASNHGLRGFRTLLHIVSSSNSLLRYWQLVNTLLHISLLHYVGNVGVGPVRFLGSVSLNFEVFSHGMESGLVLYFAIILSCLQMDVLLPPPPQPTVVVPPPPPPPVVVVPLLDHVTACKWKEHLWYRHVHVSVCYVRENHRLVVTSFFR